MSDASAQRMPPANRRGRRNRASSLLCEALRHRAGAVEALCATLALLGSCSAAYRSQSTDDGPQCPVAEGMVDE